MKKVEHPRGRAPRSLPYQGSPSLSTGWMHGRSGRTCTFVAREGVAFTARRICCSATLRNLGARAGLARARRARCYALRLRRPGRAAALPHPEIMGLEQELHLRPSPYEGAALTAAPPSQIGGDRGSCSLTLSRVRAGCPSTVA